MLTKSYGPFLKGVTDGMNVELDSSGFLRFARNMVFNGVGRLLVRPGTAVAMTLKDDVGGNVTSVLKIVEFADGALAVAHSTVTSKFYLYRFDAALTGWFDAAGAFQATTNAQPVAVLWSGAAAASPVFVAEGLGEAFIAHANATVTFQSKRYSVASGLADLQANLDGTGIKNTYFRGLVSFQQHLWGWGYGSQAAGDNDRPELARFGIAIFGTSGGGYFTQPDAFTIGHRVRAARERIVAAVLSGEVLYFGTPQSVWPVTGFGRNSWDRSRPRDDKFGFASGQAAVDAGGVLYYWSRRGPMRIAGLGETEPLWNLLPRETTLVTNPTGIVAVFDSDRDQVIWFYQDQLSGRVSRLAAFDVEREAFLGPDGDIGLGLACASFVQPTAFPGPSATPNTLSTTAIGGTVATANWLNGDPTAGVRTIVEIKRVADVFWTVAADLDSAITSYQFTGLTSLTQYHWRVKHRKNGQDSAYLGPVAATIFNTAAALAAPTTCALTGTAPYYLLTGTWVNTELGASTEVSFDRRTGVFQVEGTSGPGGASWSINANQVSGQYRVRVRHVRAGYVSSGFSNIGVFVVP